MNTASLSRRLLSIACVALIFVFAVSCSKDDAVAKRIKIDGTSYSLAHGYISDNGSAEDDNGDVAKRYTVILTSKDLTVTANGQPDGTGDYIYVNFFSTSNTELAAGTYTIDYLDYLTGTVTDSELGVNFSAANGTTDADFYISEGTVKVSKSGSKYTFKFTGKVVNTDTEEEVSFSASFEGTLTTFNNVS